MSSGLCCGPAQRYRNFYRYSAIDCAVNLLLSQTVRMTDSPILTGAAHFAGYEGSFSAVELLHPYILRTA